MRSKAPSPRQRTCAPKRSGLLPEARRSLRSPAVRRPACQSDTHHAARARAHQWLGKPGSRAPCHEGPSASRWQLPRDPARCRQRAVEVEGTALGRTAANVHPAPTRHQVVDVGSAPERIGLRQRVVAQTAHGNDLRPGLAQASASSGNELLVLVRALGQHPSRYSAPTIASMKDLRLRLRVEKNTQPPGRTSVGAGCARPKLGRARVRASPCRVTTSTDAGCFRQRFDGHFR